MDSVRLTVVGSEMEADIVCGLLRTEGIPCGHRETDFGSVVFPGGPREILVAGEDLARARELLAAEGSAP